MTTIPLLGAYPLEIFLGGRCFNVSGVDEAVRLLEEAMTEDKDDIYAKARTTTTSRMLLIPANLLLCRLTTRTSC